MSDTISLNLGAPNSSLPSQTVPPPKNNGSTGPRTAAGKQRSARNSWKHGFTSTELHVAAHEQEEFDAFKNDLLNEVQPAGTIQMILFNALLFASWSLLRIARMEAEYMAQGPEALMDPDIRKALELLNRYHARHERSLYRARKELEQLQTAEIVRQLLPEEVQAAAPPMANPMKIHTAKRTADKAWLEEEGALPVTVEPRSAHGDPYANGFPAAHEANVKR
jgi:hypothetical protein